MGECFSKPNEREEINQSDPTILECHRRHQAHEATRYRQELEKWKRQQDLEQQQWLLPGQILPQVFMHQQQLQNRDASSQQQPSISDRFAASNVPWIEWTDLDYVQEVHQISRNVAENIVQLLKDNTIPFVARYRRHMTQGMNANELRNVKSTYNRANLIKQKANAVIKKIETQGKLTAEYYAFVQCTKSLYDLDHICSMFEVRKANLAERARDIGLGKPALAIITGERIVPLNYLINSRTKGLKTEKQVRDGIVSILADMISKDTRILAKIRVLRGEHSMSIETNKLVKANKEEKEPKTNERKNEENKYSFYHNFSALESNLTHRQILEINHGEAQKHLDVKVKIPAQFEQAFKEYCAKQYANACKASNLHGTLLNAAFDYAWSKSIKWSVARQTRKELKERAEIASIDVFAENVRQLLITPPVRGKVILGIYPGFRHGCKLAVVSERGDVRETETINPHDASNPDAKREAELTLARIVFMHECSIFALGNGTASRETEIFLVELIEKGVFEPAKVVRTIVDEKGASIFSRSQEASTEFPYLDANIVSAIFIARRLQNPIAELVKIEPKYLGTGMYRNELPEKRLVAKLNEVIMEAVSFVGVDVNTASISLLKRVAGLDESKAKNLIDWRNKSGPFRTRDDLKKVRGICTKTFQQCAGFIKVIPETAVWNDYRATRDPLNYLDQTWIHPESYAIAEALVNAAKCNLIELGTKSFVFGVKLFAGENNSVLAKNFNTNVETIKIIVEGLSLEKGQDVRAKADVAMFRKNLMSIDDLKVGKVLTGIVRNKTDFGAFVDVGVEKDGLIHKTKMAGVTLSVGQRVETKVNSVDKERRRVGLTLISRV